MKQIDDLPPEFRKLIEDVTVDRHGNVIPKLYSKAQANRDLREMLNIGGRREPAVNNVAELSDQELIAQLADLSKQLGVDINVNYSFAQPPAEEPLTDSDPPIVEAVAPDVTADADDEAAAAELRIADQPARPVRGGRALSPSQNFNPG